MSRPTKNITEEQKKEAKRLARKKYVLKNKLKVLEQQKKWKINNFGLKTKLSDDEKKEKIKTQKKEWVKNNKTKINESVKKYRKNNPDKVKEQHNKSVKKRKSVDELFRLKCRVRSSISKTLKRFNVNKNDKTSDILGCSFEEFKIYLESKFEPWMNWDNYGKYNGTPNYGWDIDHIEPLSSAKTEESVLQLCNYTNLQPLCSKINRDIKKDLNTQTIMLELSMDF